jgi:hypothetical protein
MSHHLYNKTYLSSFLLCNIKNILISLYIIDADLFDISFTICRSPTYCPRVLSCTRVKSPFSFTMPFVLVLSLHCKWYFTTKSTVIFTENVVLVKRGKKCSFKFVFNNTVFFLMFWCDKRCRNTNCTIIRRNINLRTCTE